VPPRPAAVAAALATPLPWHHAVVL